MIFFILNYNVIWGCIISAILGAGAVTLFFLLKGGKKKKTIDEMKRTPKREMIIGLRDNAEAFSDIYEPLFLLASGKTARRDWVFDAWNTRVNELDGYSEFKSVFTKFFGDVASWKGKKSKYVKNADKLLKFIFKAGINREDASVITANETTAEKYDIIGAGSIEAGIEYDVFVPYWSIKTGEGIDAEETVLCKGAIR